MSNLIMCPGCDNILLDDEIPNNQCPHCGFSFNNKEEVEEAMKVYICPVCGQSYTQHQAYKKNYICEYCGNKVVRSDINMSKYLEFCVYDDTTKKENTKNLCNKFGDNQFSEPAYYDRMSRINKENRERRSHSQSQQPTQNVPKCPTCGSTNIEKISGSKRWLTTGLFGLASSNVGKTMHCKNCGYKW